MNSDGAETSAGKDGDQPSEQDLLAQLRDGNRVAQHRFVLRHQDDVFYLALGLLGNRQDAEDVMQEVFIKALRAIDRFQGQSALSTWLYRITVNTCREQQRKRRWKVFSYEGLTQEQRERAADHPGADPLALASGKQMKAELNKALASLSLAERQVFVLRKFQELSVQESAAVLGIAEGTIKSLLFRGLAKLRTQLDGMANTLHAQPGGTGGARRRNST